MYQVYVYVNDAWQPEGQPHRSYGNACRYAAAFETRTLPCCVRRVRA
ncbi:hypothetical protein [Luteimonas sp. RC10]|nr:hypothetical protein [Luteimonas sp. RC10]MBB3344523.1 hypothetical protein [Luteimonas sp. RC10]